MLRLVIFCLLCIGAFAQIPAVGKCPNVEVIQNFDISKYMGVWYEAKKYFAIFELGGKCISANYSLNSDGSVKVVNSQINSLTGNSMSIEGIARLVNSDKADGNLTVVFLTIPGQKPSPYLILDTDYENYSVVYTCTEFALYHAQIIWILTRNQAPTESVLEQAYNVMDKYKISKQLLMTTNQENCA